MRSIIYAIVQSLFKSQRNFNTDESATVNDHTFKLTFIFDPLSNMFHKMSTDKKIPLDDGRWQNNKMIFSVLTEVEIS